MLSKPRHLAMALAAVLALAGMTLPSSPVSAAPVRSASEQAATATFDALADSGPSERIPPEVLAQVRAGNPAALRQRGLELRRRLDARPNDFFLMHALATVMYHEGDAEQAQRLWDTTSRSDPNLASAAFMTELQELDVELALGRSEPARKRLGSIEKRFAKDPHFHLVRGEQAMRGRNPKAAEAAYRRAHELGPRLWVTSLNLARFLEATRRDAAAAGRLYAEATRLGASRPEPWSHLASYQMRQNQPDAALESLRKARALDATAPLPERRMADMAVMLGRYEDARRWYRSALETRPPEAEALSIRVALGDVLLRLGRHAEARTEIEAVLKVQALPPLVFALATIDEAEGKTAAAEQRYREMLLQSPRHALAANNLAMLLIRTNKGTAEALELAERARRELPNNAIVEGTWGCALVENRQPEPAVEPLRASLRAQPDGDAWTHYCLGKALVDLRRQSEAVPHLEKALRLDPAFPRREAVQRLLAAGR